MALVVVVNKAAFAFAPAALGALRDVGGSYALPFAIAAAIQLLAAAIVAMPSRCITAAAGGGRL